MSERRSRREFLSGMVVTGAAARTLRGAEENTLLDIAGRTQPESAPPVRIPSGRLGTVEVSRLILGGNLLHGWMHSRDLLYVSPLAKAYQTEDRVFKTIAMVEERGVNTVACDMMQLDLVNKYRKQTGGKIQTLVGTRPPWDQWKQVTWEVVKTAIDKAIDDGGTALFLHGGFCDRMVEWNAAKNVDLLGRGVDYIRKQGLTAGLGSHSLAVPVACDRHSIAPDFYFKSFHHDQYWSATPKARRKEFSVDAERFLDHDEFHDNIYCLNPEETTAYMHNKKQPWVAFKTLAAGAIQPETGFRYAFENGADFIAAGMFDFQLEDDLKFAAAAINAAANRKRAWAGGKPGAVPA